MQDLEFLVFIALGLLAIKLWFVIADAWQTHDERVQSHVDERRGIADAAIAAMNSGNFYQNDLERKHGKGAKYDARSGGHKFEE